MREEEINDCICKLDTEIGRLSCCRYNETDLDTYKQLQGQVQSILKGAENFDIKDTASKIAQNTILDAVVDSQKPTVTEALKALTTLRWSAVFLKQNLFYSKNTKRLIKEIEQEAKSLLPGYQNLFVELGEITMSGTEIEEKSKSMLEDMGVGLEETNFYPKPPSESFTRREFSCMLEMSACAYEEKYDEVTANEYGFRSLPIDRIPQIILESGNYKNGCLRVFDDLQTMLLYWKDCVVLAFAGTEFNWSRLGTVGTDVAQLVGHSAAYYHAAGLVKLMLDKNPDKRVFIIGHSLGGGLAQFSACANADESDNIVCVAFNSAGLSPISISHLTRQRIEKISSHVHVISSQYDYISIVGTHLGKIQLLHGGTIGAKAHFIDELKRLI